MEQLPIKNWNSRTAVAMETCMSKDSGTSPIETRGTWKPLDLSEFEPQSMLEVKRTPVERSRYPVIDLHAHMSFSAEVVNGVHLIPERQYLGTPEELIPVMDRKNVRMLNNLTAGFGSGLDDAIARYDKAFPGRFCTFTEPWYSRFLEPNYPTFQAEAIEQARRSGAKGLKILKTLGLFLRENITTGNLVKIDDPRFDPMWETCASLHMPVGIHVSDPVAFFNPVDRYNERYEELNNHPDWSFHGQGYPSNSELLAARDRLFARHPQTQFIALHAGNFAENLDHVSASLDRFPNMSVDIAARVGELGRQPRASREFFEKYQDRILFGTDAIPHGHEYPQQLFCDQLYEVYYRFLETDDEYFDYAPAKIPPQGRWQISGIKLPDSILKKVYYENATRYLGIDL
jgi:predicted TIM-barrel fold metal-dependent hydrolase